MLVADDQAVVRLGLRLVVDSQADMTAVGEAADGLDAVALAARLRPDVVLMDVRMPGLDGLSATRRIVAEGRGRATPVRVLVITTFEIDEYVFGALRAGAGGFLLKDAPPESILAGIRTVHAGDGLLAPSATRAVIEQFVRHATTRAVPAAFAPLTARELDVTRLVARGLTNAEIARRLTVGESTVKTHLGHALGKLGLRDRVQLVVLAYETGLLHPGDRP